MKYYLSALILILALTNCSTKKNTNSTNTEHLSDTNLQDSLAFELCQLYGLDQGVRSPYDKGGTVSWPAIQYADTIAFYKLMAFVKDNGFPHEELLGEHYKRECVQAAAAVVLLHNPHMLVNNKAYKDVFINEVKKGNMQADFLATVLDKYYWVKKANEHKVLYGSQFGMPCKDIKEETNKARAEIGLAPLADSLFKDCTTPFKDKL